MAWGIYDTVDDCWIGDENGPNKYGEFLLARIAAQIAEDQLFGSDLGGRLEARELEHDGLRLKDEMPVKRSGLKSIQRIEGG